MPDSFIVTAPGEDGGPCDELCFHCDCMELRANAALICAICKKSIGFEVAYMQFDLKIAHVRCVAENQINSRPEPLADPTADDLDLFPKEI